MLQTVAASLEQTIIFSCLLALAILLFLRFKREPLGFSLLVTSELKGFAILTIILGHIGYFLFTDHSFLYPLSTISGVGVDIFFLLSGYGLAISSLKKNYQPKEFYSRRIGKIFLLLWIVLTIILILDAVLLNQFYDWQIILKSFLGFYPRADIYLDINSPLWYLTPLLFYYLIFPWVFRPRWALLSAAVMAVISYIIVRLPLPVSEGIRNLYLLHYLAFPLGVALASLSKVLQNFGSKILNNSKAQYLNVFRYILLICLLIGFIYTASAGGNALETQLLSLACTMMILMIFVFSKLHFKLLEVLGNYSYEIYLLHWPLLYRYDFLYRFFPAGISTALYLIIMLVLAYLLKKIAALISFKKQV